MGLGGGVGGGVGAGVFMSAEGAGSPLSLTEEAGGGGLEGGGG